MPPTPTPVVGPLSVAWGQAEEASRQLPDILGIPWVDRAKSQLVVPAVNTEGLAAASKILALPGHAQVASRVDTVRHSRSELQRIVDGAIQVQLGGIVVWDSIPVPERDGVILVVDQSSDEFLNGLAARFDPSAIAVYVRPRHVNSMPDVTSRDTDVSAYSGGAKISAPHGGCTSGFAWSVPSSLPPMMLTAGHCAATGDTSRSVTSWAGATLGSVDVNSTTYTWGKGTVLLPGQTMYRGDLSLIRMDAGRASTGLIYRGAVGSTQAASVGEMWNRHAYAGDQYCTGGSFSGELCQFTVYAVGINHRYTNGDLLQNVVQGSRGGSCTIGGDSGGPVYTVRTDGAVAAKGIHNGSSTTGCDEWFTDIWDANAAFPGGLTLGWPQYLGDNLYGDRIVNPNQYLLSAIGPSGQQYTAIMQGTDGNFVVYSSTGGVVWSPYTQGHPNAYMTLQAGDGNLVIRAQGGAYIWDSKTYVNHGVWLGMQGDGNLVLYCQGAIAIWVNGQNLSHAPCP